MPLSMRILPHRSLVIGSLRGRMTPADLRQSVRSFAEHPDFRPNLNRLVLAHSDVDVSESFLNNLFTIKEDMIEHYFDGAIPNAESTPLYKTAIVTSSTGNEMITRLFQAVLDSDMPSVVALQTFRDIHDALAWLSLSETPLVDLEPELGHFLASA
ncbi:MAG: STAS/SEC14 domain-containing protein [Rhodospirillales bacterium]|nr:STAS/SEC14 domain-containing protein [Rhodospirillales bacterium]